MRFHTNLDTYSGPLDLLLYLVRQHELDVSEISISLVTEQFLEHLSVLETLNVDHVGDFLELATMLMEIKSRTVLPRSEELDEEQIDDPSQELVQRLLEYKEFRDAAQILEEQGRLWRARLPRRADDVVPRRAAAEDQPIHELELWDLVSAFGRVMQSRHEEDRENLVRYDETPIHVFMERIYGQVCGSKEIAFQGLFSTAAHRSTLVGMFLALLELIRYKHIRALQKDLFGEIWLREGAVPLPDGQAKSSEEEPASDGASAAAA